MIRLISVLLISLLVVACGGHKEVAVAETYADALDRTAKHRTVDPDSREEAAAISRLQAFLSEMTADRIRADIRDVYAPGVFLNDTLKTVEGVDALEEYFIETVQRTDFVRVRFDDTARSGRDYYLRWFMEYRSERINGGAVVASVGMTHIRFDEAGKVVLHQDYWDSADGFFERLPVLGWMIRSVKSRL